ncbi:MAG: hypothetical protein NTV01_13645 [Bacteroidia bacterium]|nr:hypothetical protein [Bacteroidia bacterium]
MINFEALFKISYDLYIVCSGYKNRGNGFISEILDDIREPITYQYYRKMRKGDAPKNAPTYIDKSKFEKIKYFII